jgi:hypothetical protein
MQEIQQIAENVKRFRSVYKRYINPLTPNDL